MEGVLSNDADSGLMAVCEPDEPRGARRIVHSALARRASRIGAVLGLQGPLHTLNPLPLYRLPARAALRDRPLSAARHAGWCYPVLAQSGAAVATLEPHAGKLRFCGIGGQAFAKRLLDSCLFAEQHLERTKRNYRPRILEVPSLHLQILWLHARNGESRFVVPKDAGLQLSGNIRPFLRKTLRCYQVPVRKKGVQRPSL